MAGKVVGSLASKCLQLCRITTTDAPDVFDGNQFQRLDTLLVRVYHAAMVVTFIFLGEFRGYLSQRFVRCQTDADGHAYFAFHPLMQSLAPLLQLVELNAVEIHKALVDRVTEISGSLFADDADDTGC